MVYKFFNTPNFYTHCFTFRAFVAHSENVLVGPNLEHEERSILEEHKGKLKVDGNMIPDPIAMKQVGLVKKTVFQNCPQYFITILQTI